MTDIDIIAEVKSDRLKVYWRRLKIMTFAMLMFSLIYGIIIFVLERFRSQGTMTYITKDREFNLMVRNIMVVLSLLTIFAVIIVIKKLSQRVSKGTPIKSDTVIYSPLAPNLAAYLGYKFIVLAMVDIIGLYGLVIYWLTKDLQWSFILIGLSYIIKLINIPSQNRFINIMAKYR